jgi:hypothetical protein
VLQLLFILLEKPEEKKNKKIHMIGLQKNNVSQTLTCQIRLNFVIKMRWLGRYRRQRSLAIRSSFWFVSQFFSSRFLALDFFSFRFWIFMFFHFLSFNFVSFRFSNPGINGRFWLQYKNHNIMKKKYMKWELNAVFF